MKKLIVLVVLAIAITSCSTSKTCHAKKAYVCKEVLKAQRQPRH